MVRHEEGDGALRREEARVGTERRGLRLELRQRLRSRRGAVGRPELRAGGELAAREEDLRAKPGEVGGRGPHARAGQRGERHRARGGAVRAPQLAPVGGVIRGEVERARAIPEQRVRRGVPRPRCEIRHQGGGGPGQAVELAPARRVRGDEEEPGRGGGEAVAAGAVGIRDSGAEGGAHLTGVHHPERARARVAGHEVQLPRVRGELGGRARRASRRDPDGGDVPARPVRPPEARRGISWQRGGEVERAAHGGEAGRVGAGGASGEVHHERRGGPGDLVELDPLGPLGAHVDVRAHGLDVEHLPTRAGEQLDPRGHGGDGRRERVELLAGGGLGRREVEDRARGGEQRGGRRGAASADVEHAGAGRRSVAEIELTASGAGGDEEEPRAEHGEEIRIRARGARVQVRQERRPAGGAVGDEQLAPHAGLGGGEDRLCADPHGRRWAGVRPAVSRCEVEELVGRGSRSEQRQRDDGHVHGRDDTALRTESVRTGSHAVGPPATGPDTAQAGKPPATISARTFLRSARAAPRPRHGRGALCGA